MSKNFEKFEQSQQPYDAQLLEKNRRYRNRCKKIKPMMPDIAPSVPRPVQLETKFSDKNNRRRHIENLDRNQLHMRQRQEMLHRQKQHIEQNQPNHDHFFDHQKPSQPPA